jgi:hypothetical protein
MAWDHFDGDGNGDMDEAELHVLMVHQKEHTGTMEHIEPWFPFNRPYIVLNAIRLVMWINSQTIALLLFHLATGMKCYTEVRGDIIIILTVVCSFLGLFHQGYTVGPLPPC